MELKYLIYNIIYIIYYIFIFLKSLEKKISNHLEHRQTKEFSTVELWRNNCSEDYSICIVEEGKKIFF